MKKNLFTLIAMAIVVSCSADLEESHEIVNIQGSKGTLVGNVDRPAIKSDKCPVVIIYHGLTGYRSENHINAVADSLFAHGIAVVRFDFNGHGESEGEFVDMTLDNELLDARKVFEYVEGLDWVDKSRIAISGHSQGGLITGVLAGDLGADKVRCTVLMAPAACIHTMAISGNMFGIDASQEELPEYIEFWGGRHLGREYLRSACSMDVFGRSSAYKGPVLVLQGTKDSEELMADAARYPDYLENCEYKWLEGLTHCYPEDYALPAGLFTDFVLRNFK